MSISRIAFASIFSKNMISNSKINMELRETRAHESSLCTGCTKRNLFVAVVFHSRQCQRNRPDSERCFQKHSQCLRYWGLTHQITKRIAIMLRIRVIQSKMGSDSTTGPVCWGTQNKTELVLFTSES